MIFTFFTSPAAARSDVRVRSRTDCQYHAFCTKRSERRVIAPVHIPRKDAGNCKHYHYTYKYDYQTQLSLSRNISAQERHHEYHCQQAYAPDHRRHIGIVRPHKEVIRYVPCSQAYRTQENHVHRDITECREHAPARPEHTFAPVVHRTCDRHPDRQLCRVHTYTHQHQTRDRIRDDTRRTCLLRTGSHHQEYAVSDYRSYTPRPDLPEAHFLVQAVSTLHITPPIIISSLLSTSTRSILMM